MDLPSEDQFSLKERIEFAVKWWFVDLLDTYMETYQGPIGEKPKFYRLTHQAAKNTFWNDRMESFVEVKSLLPCRMDTLIKEGKGYRKESIIFERELGRARFSTQDPQPGRFTLKNVNIDRGSMDPLSAFYNIRKRLSPSNPCLELEGITGSRRFTLRGKLVEEEKITVHAGTFKTYRCECSMRYWQEGANVESADKRKNNPFTLWVSQDEHRFPVQIRYHLPLGNLLIQASSVQHCELVS